MIRRFLTGSELDEKVLGVVGTSGSPIKTYAIFDRLNGSTPVQPHEVARSVWRLVERGKVTVRAGQGVSMKGQPAG